MKVSLNTVKQYTDVDASVDELVAKINAQLGGVEGVVNLAARYEAARIVRVVGCEKHPNADKLNICKVDDDGSVADVPRDAAGLVQVVCGAPNVHADMWAVWLPPGSIVPMTASDDEPFTLGARELRGVVSQGMLASAKELGLGDSHDGIVELSANDLASTFEGELRAGQHFGEVFGLNDMIIEIENKMFTHRPDCFGQLGVAREIAGIYHKEFTDPDWYWKLPQLTVGDGLGLEVFNEASEKVPRFMAIAMKEVEVKPSPVWLQAALVRMGAKPINNVVDVTNYVMLLTGQPTHAYDYDKLRGGALGARMAKEGEKVKLLNGKAYQLEEDDIVIVDGEGPVGLAGIMGGGESEVSDDTKNIVLEVASFNMYAVRKSSMRHGIFTDALTRFNKGQSPLQNDRALHLLMRLVNEAAGGSPASEVFDLHQLGDTYDRQSIHDVLRVGVDFINERLGLQLTGTEIAQLLRNVHFACHEPDENGTLHITAPFWRTDIEVPEDIVEEVGRLYGFDKLPRELPRRSITPPPLDEELQIKRRIRASLAGSGANEVLTYSFVHEKLLGRAGLDPANAYRLSNALSPDLQYYRYSPLVSLLDKVHMNIKAGHDEFALFEIGKGHDKTLTDEDGLPAEPTSVELVYAARQSKDGAAFYRARRLIEQLASDLGIALIFAPINEAPAPYAAGRTAVIMDINGNELGMVGEVDSTVRRNFKLPAYSASASLDLARVATAVRPGEAHYRPLSRFPSVSQDISLKVDAATPYGDVIDLASKVAAEQSDYDITVAPRSIYQPEDAATKTVTLRLTVSSHERTLTDAEVQQVIALLSARATDELKAETV